MMEKLFFRQHWYDIDGGGSGKRRSVDQTEARTECTKNAEMRKLLY